MWYLIKVMNVISDVLYVSLHNNKSQTVAVFCLVCVKKLNDQSEILRLMIEKSELSLEILWLISVHHELSFESSGGIKQ